MSLNIKVSGAYKETLSLDPNVSGTWKKGRDLWTKVSGVWKLVWSAVTATLNAGFYSGSATQISSGQIVTAQFSAVCTATGGSVTYFWNVGSGYSTLVGQGTSNITVRLTDSAPTIVSENISCTVTDANGISVTSAASPWTLTINGSHDD